MINTKEKIIEHFKSGIKKSKNFKIGIEHEKFLFNSSDNKRIDYLKLKANSNVLLKIENITKKNRVLLNPSFNIVDCRNRKNINLKFKKLYFKGKKNEN